MRVEIPNIVFTICFHFEGEVDMPLKTFSGPSIVPSVLTNGATVEIDEEKLIKTPVQQSLEFAQAFAEGKVNMRMMNELLGNILEYRMLGHKWRESIFERFNCSVKSTYGLIQNMYQIEVECDYENFSPAMVKKLTEELKKVFEKYVFYYDNKTPWVITDIDDETQMGRALSEDIFEFKNELTDVARIDFRFIDEDRMEDMISGYYDSLDEVKKYYPNNWKFIVAECGFENVYQVNDYDYIN